MTTPSVPYQGDDYTSILVLYIHSCTIHPYLALTNEGELHLILNPSDVRKDTSRHVHVLLLPW